jgi:hypothetical protein
MPTDPLSDAVEAFSLPVEQFIVALGRGISEAQRALDENSIATQGAIDADPVLAGYGLQATWYQFPKVDLQLKLAITIAAQEATPPSGAAAAPTDTTPRAASSPALGAARLVSLIAQPVSASYQTQFNYDAQASSTLSLSIVPVPSPRSSSETTAPAQMKAADVQVKALSSPAAFVRDEHGNPIAGLRFHVHFNAASRTWYVLQYDPANPAINAAIVAVDDATGTIRVIASR